MKKLLPFIWLLFSCSPDAAPPNTTTSDARLYVNGDTINFDQKYFNLYSSAYYEAITITLKYGTTPQDSQELALSHNTHSTGMFFIENYVTSFQYHGTSPTNPNIHYESQVINTPTDSNYIQFYNISALHINGDFHCYLRAYYDTTYTGLHLATGYFNFTVQ